MLQIDEIGTIGERINKLVNHFAQGNKTAFGRAADIQSGVLAGIVGGRESKPGFEILQKLLTAYPSINPIWLLFGREEMLQSRPDFPVQLKRTVDASSSRVATLKELLGILREKYLYISNQIHSISLEQKSASELSPEEKRLYDDKLNEALVMKQEIVESGAPIRAELELLTQHLSIQQKHFDEVLDRVNTAQPTLTTIYRINGEPELHRPYNGLLTQRLSISEATAYKLISDGMLRAVAVGEEGYRVTELAVREFLGEATHSINL
jgi:excisionase family DNA binding protein